VANRSKSTPGVVLDDIDSVFERGAAWVGARPQLALVALGALLLVGAGISGYGSMRERSAQAAEAEIGEAIELTRALRRWRDLAGVAAGEVLAARAGGGPPHELVSRLARVSFDGAEGEAMATVGGIELLETAGIDPEAVRARIEERLEKLRSEVARAEGKLSNEGFVAKAPADVVDAERSKLEAYRAELDELGLDPEFFEGARPERHLGREPGDIESGCGRQNDPIGRSCEDIFVDAPFGKIDPDLLAGFAQSQ